MRSRKLWISDAFYRYWYSDYKHTILHRLDGPAIQALNRNFDDSYYINGIEYSVTEFYELTKKFKAKDITEASNFLNV